MPNRTINLNISTTSMPSYERPPSYNRHKRQETSNHHVPRSLLRGCSKREGEAPAEPLGDRVFRRFAARQEPRLIAAHLGYIYMASLSPKSDRVVFSGPARGYRLLLAALPDGKPIELTPDHPKSFVPQFTPDGKTIIFLRCDGDIYRVDADGKNLRRLTTGNRYVEFKLSGNYRHGSTDGPHLSPDGKKIAYIAVTDGIPNVCIMNTDGTEDLEIRSLQAPPIQLSD